METGGAAGATGAGLAATSAKAINGEANHAMLEFFRCILVLLNALKALRHVGDYRRRDELVDRAAIAGDFFHQP